MVSAGDLISASPLTSSLFLDEPTIEVMNDIQIDFNAVGNHEFDRGTDELRRLKMVDVSNIPALYLVKLIKTLVVQNLISSLLT